MLRLAIATNEIDIAPYVALASERGIGLEIQVYGYRPDLLDRDWRRLVEQHKRLLRGFSGELALHGVFLDMSSASIDRRVVALTRERYMLNLRIATELGATHVVFHANFQPHVRRPDYLPDWTKRQVDFWSQLADQAGRLGITIALENMWEPEPEIIAAILERVASPALAACLDVGHVYLYTDSAPFPSWVGRLHEWVVHCHINNHRGRYDEHLPLDTPDGVIDYAEVLPLLESLPRRPLVCLEMDRLEDLQRSLRYLGS